MSQVLHRLFLPLTSACQNKSSNPETQQDFSKTQQKRNKTLEAFSDEFLAEKGMVGNMGMYTTPLNHQVLEKTTPNP